MTTSHTIPPSQPVAIVTGGSHGLGRALVTALAGLGWAVVTDGRRQGDLAAAVRATGSARVVGIPGDVTYARHRTVLVETAATLGELRLLVNNASQLGASPQPPLRTYNLDALRSVYETNVMAPLGLSQAALPLLAASGGVIVNVTSDAAVETYERWGGYGSSKAALEQISAILGAEEPTVSVYAFDPGDMRTEMHAAAFPGEDISGRPSPETVVPSLLRLVETRPPSGRYQASDLAALATAGAAS
jgi:NAD(P)-dependent dehydrogenase (short-subunit alcohol dehydrogenase family)